MQVQQSETTLLFDFTNEAVTEIQLQNGNTGAEITYSQNEDIAAILNVINNFKYSETEVLEPAEGWTYRVKVLETNGKTTDFYISSEGNNDLCIVEMESTKYISPQHNYFDDFIEEWMPKQEGMQ